MSKLKGRKLAAIALSSCMAICVGAAVGITAHKNSVTASADTAKYYAVTESYSATVSRTNPAAVKLSEKAGQYVLTAVITHVDGEPISWDNWEFYDLVATVNGESVYLNYNLGTHTFTGVIMVGDMDSLELSTFTDSELTLSITLGDLYLGQDNDFTLANVQIPANKAPLQINLNDLMGKYKISVELGMDELEEGKSITVVAGDSAVTLSKDANYWANVYSGELDFGTGATSLTIISTNTTALTATISLSEVKEYAELPASVELEMWTAVTYKYTASKTGFFSLNTSSADSMAQVSITFKNDAESFEGLNVTENNYPLYMEADSVYYFELVLMNASNNASATINTAVENWEKPTIMTDVAYPVPVTAAGKDKVTMNVVAEEDEYELSLMNAPFNWYTGNVTVIANIGGEEIPLNSGNNYTEKVFLDGQTTITLTSNAAETTTVALYIATPEVRNYITLGAAKAITVPAATTEDGYVIPGNVIYYLENAQAGYYDITLSENNNVSVDANWLPAVLKGNTYGGFKVTENGSEIAIEFYNYGTEEATFKATVDKLGGEYDLKLGKTEIVIKEGTSIFYLEGLAIGSYNLVFENLPEGATVSIDGEEITLVGGKAEFTLSEEQANIGLVTVMITSKVAGVATVEITPKNMMELDKPMTINAEDAYNYTAYYMVLEAGTYTIKLDAPESMYVYIVAGGEWLTIEEGMATFTVAEGGYVALKFDIYNYSAENTLTVEVTKA